MIIISLVLKRLSLWAAGLFGILETKRFFEYQNPSIQETMRFFRENFELVRHRAKPSLKEGMSQWLDTL
jgi:hypothetical protein